MADEFKKIISIEIDQTVITNARKSANELAKEIRGLKDAQKVAKISGKELTEEYVERDAKIKALSKEQRTNSNILQQANKITKAAKGSNEELRSQLSILTAQYNKLSKEERDNTDEGKRMQKQIRSISDELKANEKAVGDNRRNVGNYEDALKNLPAPIQGVIGGLKGMVTAAKAFIATPFGAAIAGISLVLSPLIAFLTKTKEGSELLTRAFAGVEATVSVLIDRIAALGGAMVKVFEGDFKGAAEDARGAFSGITEEIVRETEVAVALEKQMQTLVDAERALTVERSKSRAQIKELNKIAEDTSKTLKEREDAAVQAIAIETDLMDKQVALAQERFDIIAAQNAQGESLAEDLDRQAEAEKALADIRMESFEMQTTLQNKLNTIRQQDQAMRQKAADTAKKLSEQEIKAEQDRIKAIEQGYKDERNLIDQMAETKRNQAVLNIANAEAQAEAIRFIDREALLEKLRSIDDETAAYTASADMVGAVDEEKYAKQLAERAKYEAQLAAMDRAAKADEFNREIELLNGREELANQAAELEIDNEQQLENRKYQIALEFAQKRLALMQEQAMMDDILTEKEIQNLKKVENTIKQLQETLANPEAPTAAQSLGLSDQQIEDMQLGLTAISQALQAVQAATQAAADNRIKEIDNQTEAEKAAVEKSTLSEKKKKEKITAIEKKAAKERYKVELAQFKTAKALQIALAVANTATAVMAQLSNPTPYAGFVLAALAAATGAVQIGIVASQKPPPPPAFATGGKVLGAGSGTSDSIPARLSNGEAVINAKSTAMFEPMLSAMNAAGGGVDWYNGGNFAKGGLVQKFAAGGVATSSGLIMRENEAQAQLQNTILQTPPVLVLEEFQNVQGRQVRTEQNLQI